MNPITFPLEPRTRGAAVTDLQDALLFLIAQGLLALSDADRRAFGEHLSAERTENIYNDVTQKLVAIFQEQHRLQPTGAVDEPTARALNALIAPTATAPAAPECHRLVGGQVLRADGRPFPGGLVRAFAVSQRGMLRLGGDTTDAEGRYTIRYAMLPGVSAIVLRVVVSDADGKALGEAETDGNAQPLELLDLVVTAAEGETFFVGGRVASPVSAGIGGLQVQVVDKSVGEDVLLAQTVTDADGTYQVRFTDALLRQLGKAHPDLQARVHTGETFLAASAVRYNASHRETLDVVVDEQAASLLTAEHETLTAALAGHYQGMLRDLKETDEQQDITYLANKTGWDARAVALAALADQFSARTEGIRPAFFYALFRAGLPANESALYQADAKTVDGIWQQAIAQGVIPTDMQQRVPGALRQFQQLAVQRSLDAPAVVGLSSLKEMVSLSLGEDPAQQMVFADLYTRHGRDLPQFWAAVRDAFGEVATNRLKVDGQLAYLTLNNAPLINQLHASGGESGLTDTLALVAGGYHRAEQWHALIGNTAIPAEVPGATVAEQRSRYADLLAAQVRLSFPTAVVAQMVSTGETPLVAPELGSQVHDFLMAHHGKFEIRMQPVEQYATRNDVTLAPEVMQEITRIQRVYQITPSDDAMNQLLKRGVDSAHAVSRYDREAFVQAFKADVGGEAQARLIHTRSQQVHNAVLNIAVSYLTASHAPGVGVHSPAQIVSPTPTGPNPNAADVIAYPSLERMLGEMDYCECEHCRTILSPAAYLVDLLHFLDRDVPDTEITPLSVLLSRRPDLQSLPLTCENTNTALPYIDLVNETLEYYVVNNLSLSDYTGHTTNSDATPAELLANPQFVSDQAYLTLAGLPAQPGGAVPLLPPAVPLPFHQPLEHLRRYFDRLAAPLPKVMEALRKDDLLERASVAQYGWRDILMEELRLSRAEYARLTDRAITRHQLYGYDPATPAADVLADLANAKAFTRRMGISYADIVAILGTRFINPNADLLPKLERLGVPLATLEKLKAGTITDEAFTAALAPHLDQAQYGGDIISWVKNDANYARIMGLMLLTNPTGGDPCSFDHLEFRYANPDNATNQVRAFEFVRLFRFIRLWQKLGWSIVQTDQALTALYPPKQLPNALDDAVNLSRLDTGFRALLPRLGTVKRAIAALKLKPKRDLQPLLVCFAPIGTHGEASLYRQMFLRPAVLKQDATFADDGYGNVLDGSKRLMAHAEALRAAFQLTDDEFLQITAALGYNSKTTLTLKNISAICRAGWLARQLKLSVREFLLLTRVTGIDPFAPLQPVDPSFLRFISLVSRLRTVSLKPAQALYLLWNQDISGKSAPDDGQILGFARTLRAGFATVEAEFTLAADPDGQGARARMALVYGAEAAAQFFGVLDQKAVTDVPYSQVNATLAQAIRDVGPGAVAYDHLRKRLAYSAGVMPAATSSALKAAAGATPAFAAAVDALAAKSRSFFDRYPELQTLHDTYLASAQPAELKRAELLTHFLPALKRRRKREQALQAMGAAVKAAAGFDSALLDDHSVLQAVGDSAQAALHDLTALETPGLAGSDAAGAWTGYLDAPENGFYNFYIDAAAAATVSLTLGGAAIVLGHGSDGWSNSTPIDLRAGTLYAIALTVQNAPEPVHLRWETLGRGREPIPETACYAATLIDNLRATYTRFMKAAALAAALKLTAGEFAALARDGDFRIGGAGWLNTLPVTGTPDQATGSGLLKVCQALLTFARIKADLGPGDERLLKVLQDPATATQHPDSLLFVLARWEPTSLQALLSRFGKSVADLAHLETFRRVYDAYALVKQLGVPAAALIKAATNEPDAVTVRELQAALRARYDESDWLNVLKPINDELRALQRDALVAYILHQMRANPASAHIDTADKLFEYFLMDVQMEPIIQTSRIRHALSSVQLFIERCLMNLEPRVAPVSLPAKQWQWMSRYRVWEANRKVFLYPENWLEPELRDDQSPFFKETISELLQGDITEETAAVALLNYLAKLEEVAKLEPCGIHFIENDPGKAEDDIAHVVARTAGAHRKYYYRRREYGYWTPWEQIKLEIEDNPVLPVVWKDRLFVFWLRLVKEAPLAKPALSGDLATTDAATILGAVGTKITVKAVLCWSEYYNGKWQSTRTSDVNNPVTIGTYLVTGFDRSQLRLYVYEANGALHVRITWESGFTLYNTHSLPEPVGTAPAGEMPGGPARVAGTAGTTFNISYYTDPGKAEPLSRKLLKNQLADRVVAPRQVLARPWVAPFFYEDSRHVFYVSTAQRMVNIPQWNGYIVTVSPYVPVIVLPPLVQTKPPFDPRPVFNSDPYGAIIKAIGVGVVDTAPLERFVSEDAYISRAIGTAGMVQFGDKQIGPAGFAGKAGQKG